MRAIASSVLAAACVVYGLQSGPIAAPAFAQSPNAPTKSFGGRIRGNWLLIIQAGPLDQSVQPSSACATYTYPLRLSEAFAASVSQSIVGLFEQIESGTLPIPDDELKKRGLTGMIIVRGQELNPRLDVQYGLFRANIKSEVAIVATVNVDGQRGQVLNVAIRGEGTAEVLRDCIGCERLAFPENLLCDAGGAGRSIAEAGAAALKDTVGRITNALANSEPVRASYTLPPPPPKRKAVSARRPAPSESKTGAQTPPPPFSLQGR